MIAIPVADFKRVFDDTLNAAQTAEREEVENY